MHQDVGYIRAPSDFGRQFVAPALAQFVCEHPEVTPYLFLFENIVNLIAEGFYIGVWLGNLPDSSLMMRSLSLFNRRILCASPRYLKEYGTPTCPQDLLHHRCLVIERLGEQLNQWNFRPKSHSADSTTVKVNAALIGSDDALIRQWAIAGAGIALKSLWDVTQDIKEGRLTTVLDDYISGAYMRDSETVRLQLIYPHRKYLPRQVTGFMNYFTDYIEKCAIT